MKLNEKQIRFMQESLSVELVGILMENWHCSMTEALEMFYNSDTFDRLSNPSTGLYYQRAGYVYDILQHELTTGELMQTDPILKLKVYATGSSRPLKQKETGTFLHHKLCKA